MVQKFSGIPVKARKRKLQCLYWESDGKYLFPELNFSQFVSQNVKILGRRLYSSLKDVAVLPVADLFFFLIFAFVCTFFSANCVNILRLPAKTQKRARAHVITTLNVIG